ncbi:MAG: class I SAM-dependent methyltransferase [Anaerolineales bacterium]
MKENKDKPVAQDAYDALAEAYAARIDTKPHNAYYERPATLSLLPDVRGKRILDAGCGPGVYAQILTERGAQVVAFDANHKMVDLARQRLGEKVPVHQANLEQPLTFLADSSFDIVLSSLVLDYVKDWQPVLAEFHRVLCKGGYLVFSIEHPYPKFFDFQETNNYFNVELVEYTWRGFGTPVQVPTFRRPLSGVINPLLEAGFILDHILEPTPTQEFQAHAPKDYQELTRYPGFMCVRAVKNSKTG